MTEREHVAFITAGPMPCDDCKHQVFCLHSGGSCKVSRHWEAYGSVLMKHRNGAAARQGIKREPETRVPDSNIKIVKHSWTPK